MKYNHIRVIQGLLADWTNTVNKSNLTDQDRITFNTQINVGLKLELKDMKPTQAYAYLEKKRTELISSLNSSNTANSQGRGEIQLMTIAAAQKEPKFLAEQAPSKFITQSRQVHKIIKVPPQNLKDIGKSSNNYLKEKIADAVKETEQAFYRGTENFFSEGHEKKFTEENITQRRMESYDKKTVFAYTNRDQSTIVAGDAPRRGGTKQLVSASDPVTGVTYAIGERKMGKASEPNLVCFPLQQVNDFDGIFTLDLEDSQWCTPCTSNKVLPETITYHSQPYGLEVKITGAHFTVMPPSHKANKVFDTSKPRGIYVGTTGTHLSLDLEASYNTKVYKARIQYRPRFELKQTDNDGFAIRAGTLTLATAGKQDCWCNVDKKAIDKSMFTNLEEKDQERAWQVFNFYNLIVNKQERATESGEITGGIQECDSFFIAAINKSQTFKYCNSLLNSFLMQGFKPQNSEDRQETLTPTQEKTSPRPTGERPATSPESPPSPPPALIELSANSEVKNKN